MARDTTIAARVGARDRKLVSLAMVVGVAITHVLVYFLVNQINATRPLSVFLDFEVAADAWIPYLPWTWPIYYGAHLYITLWAAILVWSLPDPLFRPALVTYLGMIVAAGFLQIAFPAEAPWPMDLGYAQRFFHKIFALRPYACLPSMHVALAVLPAAIGLVAIKSRTIRNASTSFAILITISTVTMKEHYILDAVAGLALGLAAAAFWFKTTGAWDTRRDEQ